MDNALLVPATASLIADWCGPVFWNGRAAIWGFDLILNEDGSYDSAPDGCVVRGEVLIDLARAECRDRVARVLTRTEDHPEGWPARVQWSRDCACWELWWIADEMEVRDVVSDLGVSHAALDGIAPEDEHAALAAVAREVLRG